MRYYFLAVYLLITGWVSLLRGDYDLHLVAYLYPWDGLGKLPIECIECLSDTLSICFTSTRNLQELGYPFGNLLPLSVIKVVNNRPAFAPVTLFQDIPWYPGQHYYTKVPDTSIIKIAYSMFESTSLPKEWVTILNRRFDAVVVPDPWLVPVYTNSGVTIPIFVLPLSLQLRPFLNQPAKGLPCAGRFVFGTMIAPEPRKNYPLLLDAFARAFGNNPNVRLRINIRYNNPVEVARIRKKIRQLNLTNVEFTIKSLSTTEYINFISSLDCFVSFSQGEGFSIAPREALACGIPVILSNNTAHTTLCATGYVRAVPSRNTQPAYYDLFQQTCGSFFNCTVTDAAQALQDVYTNYRVYFEKAKQGKLWVQRYLPEQLKKKYLSLIKPALVTLGSQNSIEDGGIITTSKALYDKYYTLLQRYHKPIADKRPR
jgi:glycosyltransferase involved in cell wall biosynthesis